MSAQYVAIANALTVETNMNTYTLPMTDHANVRCRQRGLSRQVLEWLDEFGARASAAQNAELVFFDKTARRRLEQSIGRTVMRHVEPLLGAYMVQAEDGRVITTGWRCGRVQRERRPGKGATA
jgi:hypothetical protein